MSVLRALVMRDWDNWKRGQIVTPSASLFVELVGSGVLTPIEAEPESATMEPTETTTRKKTKRKSRHAASD